MAYDDRNGSRGKRATVESGVSQEVRAVVEAAAIALAVRQAGRWSDGGATAIRVPAHIFEESEGLSKRNGTNYARDISIQATRSNFTESDVVRGAPIGAHHCGCAKSSKYWQEKNPRPWRCASAPVPLCDLY